MRIGTDAPIACATGSRECWEAFASEKAALSRYATLLGDHRFADRLNFFQLVDLAFSNDQNALTALRETAKYIGIGMGNLIQGLSPEAIVIGGTIVRAWPLIGKDVEEAAGNVVCQGVHETRIIPSSLGAEPGLLGAFSLVLADKFASISL